MPTTMCIFMMKTKPYGKIMEGWLSGPPNLRTMLGNTKALKKISQRNEGWFTEIIARPLLNAI